VRTVTLSDWLQAFVETVLAPPGCAACDEPVPRAQMFCAECGSVAPVPGPRELRIGIPLISATSYEPPVTRAIHRFKYEAVPELARSLSKLVAPHVYELGLGAHDACVPVPLHHKRLAERGYNQAALLAKYIARSCGLRFMPRLLQRVIETEQQAALSRKQRSENMSDAFRVRKQSAPGRVVLIDDVVTTGETVSACVAALEEAQISVVAIASIARVDE
jgi:ComF family protein